MCVYGGGGVGEGASGGMAADAAAVTRRHQLKRRIRLGILSVFQTLGALAGAVSVSILIWDRWVKSRPYAMLTMAPTDSGGRYELRLRVVNSSRYPIVISQKLPTNGFGFRHDHSVESTYAHVMRERFEAIVAEGESRLFEVFDPNDFRTMTPDTVIKSTLSWRRAQQPSWVPTRGFMTVHITKSDVDLMRN